MSDGVYDMPEEPRRPRRTSGGRPRALLPTIATLIVLLILFSVFTDVWTQRLWYRSVDLGSVFSTVLGTRVLLFFVVGLLMATAVVANIVIAFRTRPRVALAPSPSPGFERYRRSAAAAREDRHRRGRDPHAGVRRLGRVGGVEGLPGLAEPYSVRRHRQALQQGHLVLRLRLPVAARAARFRLLDRAALLCVAAITPTTCTAVSGSPRSADGFRRGAGAPVGAARLLRAAQGGQLLAGPVTAWRPSDGRLLHRISYTDVNAVLPAKDDPGGHRVICAPCCSSPTSSGATWLLPGVGLGAADPVGDPARRHLAGLVQQFQVAPSRGRQGASLHPNATSRRPARPTTSDKVDDHQTTGDTDGRRRPSCRLTPRRCPASG